MTCLICHLRVQIWDWTWENWKCEWHTVCLQLRGPLSDRNSSHPCRMNPEFHNGLEKLAKFLSGKSSVSELACHVLWCLWKELCISIIRISMLITSHICFGVSVYGEAMTIVLNWKWTNLFADGAGNRNNAIQNKQHFTTELTKQNVMTELISQTSWLQMSKKKKKVNIHNRN